MKIDCLIQFYQFLGLKFKRWWDKYTFGTFIHVSCQRRNGIHDTERTFSVRSTRRTLDLHIYQRSEDIRILLLKIEGSDFLAFLLGGQSQSPIWSVSRIVRFQSIASWNLGLLRILLLLLSVAKDLDTVGAAALLILCACFRLWCFRLWVIWDCRCDCDYTIFIFCFFIGMLSSLFPGLGHLPFGICSFLMIRWTALIMYESLVLSCLYI